MKGRRGGRRGGSGWMGACGEARMVSGAISRWMEDGGWARTLVRLSAGPSARRWARAVDGAAACLPRGCRCHWNRADPARPPCPALGSHPIPTMHARERAFLKLIEILVPIRLLSLPSPLAFSPSPSLSRSLSSSLFPLPAANMPDARVTYRRRHSYNTRSNKTTVVKTPGGRLALQYVAKRGKGPACGDCGRRLPGIPALRPKQYAKISQRQKTVSRAYGGSRCAHCVRER